MTHKLYAKASSLTSEVIASAIEVHRDKGPGLLESIYEWCLRIELESRGMQICQQESVRVTYKGQSKVHPLKFDIVAEDCLLVEVKAVEKVLPIHKAQLLSYMKLLDIPVGLLINFNQQKLIDGVSRMMLPGAE